MSGVLVHAISPQRPTRFGNDALAIVGMDSPEGGELWVPPRTHGPGYSDYHIKDTAELVLPLDDTLAERLVSFFEGCLLPNVNMTRTLPGRWDCHSFALWMQGQITDPEKIDLDETEATEDARIQTGAKISPKKLKLGELGIIGGRSAEASIADHSVIGLDKGRGLQVLGRHSPLAIVSHDNAISAYREISRGRFSDEEYGMFVIDPRPSLLSRACQKLRGGDERT